eukprot:363870-Chlamydomonas_euryale.AAC.1
MTAVISSSGAAGPMQAWACVPQPRVYTELTAAPTSMVVGHKAERSQPWTLHCRTQNQALSTLDVALQVGTSPGACCHVNA